MTAPTPTRRFRRHATAVIAGALLLLLVAQPVLAVEWGSTARLSSLETYRPRIFRTGPSSALTVYQRGSNAYARRSVDSGKTWSAPVKIASAIRLNFSAAGYGSKVDIAYVRQVTTSTGTTSNRLYYRRSLDGGATWQASRAMTSSASNIVDQAVARHSSGRVTIAWTGYSTGRLLPANQRRRRRQLRIGPVHRQDHQLGTRRVSDVLRRAHDRDRQRRHLHRLSVSHQHDVCSAHDGQRDDLVVADQDDIVHRRAVRARSDGQQRAARLYLHGIRDDAGRLSPNDEQGRELVGRQGPLRKPRTAASARLPSSRSMAARSRSCSSTGRPVPRRSGIARARTSATRGRLSRASARSR